MTAAWHPGENTDKHDAPYQPTPSNWNSINKLSLNSEHSLHWTQHLINVFVWSIVSYDNPDDWHSSIVCILIVFTGKQLRTGRCFPCQQHLTIDSTHHQTVINYGGAESRQILWLGKNGSLNLYKHHSLLCYLWEWQGLTR